MKKLSGQLGKLGPIGVIDVGAHSARLVISQFLENGDVEVLESLNQPIPLGANVFVKGKISSKNTTMAVSILTDYAQMMKEYGVSLYKAIATSAVKEAANRDLFLHRVKNASGINLEVLEDAEEIRLIFQAAGSLFRDNRIYGDKNTLVCAIGTGVTHIAFLEKGHLSGAETIKLGTLRVLEELTEGQSSSRTREIVDPFVASVINWLTRMSPGDNPEGFIALGSSARAIAGFIDSSGEKNYVKIKRDEFAELYKKIMGMTISTLTEKYMFDDITASSLQPCCIMLEHFLETTQATELLIPMITTRDAIVHDFVCDIAGSKNSFVDEIVYCAKTLGRKYHFDAKHAESVAEASLFLFDALKEYHGLGKRERMYLHVAAILHDIGMFVSNKQHHKHAMYLVRNADIPGMLPEELNLIAVICRYHRRAVPKTSHEEYTSLSAEQRMVVNQLAAILRVADALDRSHLENHKLVETKIESVRITLYLKGEGECNLERWGLNRKADLFTDVFGLKVRLVEQN